MPDPGRRPDGARRAEHRRAERPPGADATLADKILAGPTALDALRGELDRLGNRLDRTVRADPENVERGLAQLVLTLIELLRQLMERQAVRRVEGGSLTDEEVERLGLTFLRLEERMGELKEAFGLEDADLNLDLGPLGRLL
ncbi:MAG TPA: gas vesicle protein K [Acidimicrobiales bacterium]